MKSDKNKENIDSATKALHKMKEKREWAEKEAMHIVETICQPYIEMNEYMSKNKRFY